MIARNLYLCWRAGHMSPDQAYRAGLIYPTNCWGILIAKPDRNCPAVMPDRPRAPLGLSDCRLSAGLGSLKARLQDTAFKGQETSIVIANDWTHRFGHPPQAPRHSHEGR